MINDPSVFEKPIKKKPLLNFASLAAKVKRTVNGKLKVVKMERNFLGTSLVLSMDHNLDLREAFTLLLSPIPLCLGHVDGSMN